MKNIYVVTHTESIHHVQGLAGGWYDTSLTENGRNQAVKIATALYSEIGTGNIPIHSSDLKRCAEVAGIFAEIFNSTIICNRDLREMSFGDADGKPKEWRDKNTTPKPSNDNRLDHHVFNGSESRRDVGTRIQNILGKILNEPEENVIVITHGFALTFVIMAWLRVPVENMDYCGFESSPGGVTLLSEDDLYGNRAVIYINKRDYMTA